MQKYNKKQYITYTEGIYPSIELLKYRPSQVTRVVIHSKIIQNEGYQMVKSLTEEHNIPVVFNDQIIREYSPKGNCFVMAFLKKYTTNLENSANHILLVQPANAGNLGTISRSMLAFGMTNLGIIKPAVDIFQPTVIRASMGAIFQLNFEYFESFPEYQKKFANQACYSFALLNGEELNKVKFTKPYTLIFGNEGAGLPEEIVKTTKRIKIEQINVVDSLNLAVATGIAMHSAYTQN